MTDKKRVWKYSLKSISEVTGVSVYTLRRWKREGKLKPHDLVDVSKTVLACRHLGNRVGS